MKKKVLIPIFLAGLAMPLALPQDEIALSRALFIGEYGDRTQYIANLGTPLNNQLADEGFVLLKNDGTLPLAKGSKISICGKASTNLARGGAGSGAGSTSQGVTGVDLQKSMTDAGFEINPNLTSFYKDNNKSGSGRTNGNTNWTGVSQVTIGETPLSSYDEALLASLDEYNDAALQVITREGSEGCDVKTCDCRDNNSAPFSHKHALELSDNEQALFDELKNHFDHIIFIINSSNIFECDALENDPQVAGILWIGNPGDVGPAAVGRILCGDVNPSGRTVETWARDFTKDPTFQNFSDNAQTNLTTDASGKETYAAQDTMFNADGTPMMSFGTDKNYNDYDSPRWKDEKNKVVQGGLNGVKPSAYVSYEEGIYMDYRYYETRYAELIKAEGQNTADEWYAGEEGVVYPFGYGLSYTTFEQKIVRMSPAYNANLTKDTDLIEVSVEVKNTGDVAGKDAVQLYWKAPYTNGGIEKADHVLCAFDKTQMLEPGDSQIVHLTFHLQDVANYDFMDANKNSHVGYELDAGDYAITLNKNAHQVYDEVKYKINDGINYDTDRFTGYEVTNRFTDRGFYSSMPGEDDIEFTQFSRKDMGHAKSEDIESFPSHPTIETRTVSENSRFEEFLTTEFEIDTFEYGGDYEIIPEAAHKTEQDAVAGNWSQQSSTLAKANRIQLIDLKDCEPDDPKWDEFMNEMTWAEMIQYPEKNGMSSPALNNVGKGSANEGDGPQKFDIMWWVSSPIIAATFSPELAHRQGEAVGMESQITGKSGWWGSAVNTHRSPFGGRNFEYYAADPFLMGRIAAEVIGACTDRGVFAYFKHFAVNDQEKNRESGISFVNEQALREIYLRSFQMVFEEGKSIGVMSSYNRVGLMETAASYPLLTEVLRGEWGFKGAVLSDMTHSGNSSVNFACYECVTTRVLSGCNNQLDQRNFNGQVKNQQGIDWDSTAWNGKGAPVYSKGGEKKIAWSFWYALRECVKQHMWMTLNSTLMQRGLTQVVNEIDNEVLLNEDVNIALDTEAVENFANKGVTSVEWSLNKRVVLPEGLTFEDGTISGKLAHVGLYRIDVIAHVTLDGGTETNYAYKVILRAVPDMKKDNGLDGKENGGKKKGGCGGSVVATSALVCALAACGVVILAKKKKED